MWPARPSIWTLLKLCLSTALYPLHGYLDTLATKRQLRAQLEIVRERRDETWAALSEAKKRIRKLERQIETMETEARWVTAQIEIETERRNRTLDAMRPRSN